MKKLIIIEDNSEIQVGDLFIQTYLDNPKINICTEVHKTDPTIFWRDRILCCDGKKYLKKVQLYIVDTEADLTNDCYAVSKKDITNPNSIKELHYIDSYFPLLNFSGDLVIATSNTSLPITKLSKQAIEYIVENNGEIGEFNVEIVGEALYTQEQHFKGYKDWANIIPKSSKEEMDEYIQSTIDVDDWANDGSDPKEQSIEEAAEEYCNNISNAIAVNPVHITTKDIFIAGANHFKEHHTIKLQNNISKERNAWMEKVNSMYSEDELQGRLSQNTAQINNIWLKKYLKSYTEDEVFSLLEEFNDSLLGLYSQKTDKELRNWFNVNKKK